MTPLVLDVDGSVGPLAGELRLALGDWQEAIRFGASLGRYQQFRRHLQSLDAEGRTFKLTLARTF